MHTIAHVGVVRFMGATWILEEGAPCCPSGTKKPPTRWPSGGRVSCGTRISHTELGGVHHGLVNQGRVPLGSSPVGNVVPLVIDAVHNVTGIVLVNDLLVDLAVSLLLQEHDTKRLLGFGQGSERASNAFTLVVSTVPVDIVFFMRD